jgi:hypothetical protein
MDVNLTTEQKARVTATPQTASERPASLDGPLRASVVSDGTGGASVADGNSALEVVLIPGDTPGDVTFLVEGDADLGAGVTLIQDTVILHAAGAQAAALGLGVAVENK